MERALLEQQASLAPIDGNHHCGVSTLAANGQNVLCSTNWHRSTAAPRAPLPMNGGYVRVDVEEAVRGSAALPHREATPVLLTPRRPSTGKLAEARSFGGSSPRGASLSDSHSSGHSPAPSGGALVLAASVTAASMGAASNGMAAAPSQLWLPPANGTLEHISLPSEAAQRRMSGEWSKNGDARPLAKLVQHSQAAGPVQSPQTVFLPESAGGKPGPAPVPRTVVSKAIDLDTAKNHVIDVPAAHTSLEMANQPTPPPPTTTSPLFTEI